MALSQPIADAVKTAARMIDAAVDARRAPALARELARAGPPVSRGTCGARSSRQSASRRTPTPTPAGERLREPARRRLRVSASNRRLGLRLAQPRLRAHRRPARHDAGAGQARGAGRDHPLHARRHLARPAGGRDDRPWRVPRGVFGDSDDPNSPRGRPPLPARGIEPAQRRPRRVGRGRCVAHRRAARSRCRLRRTSCRSTCAAPSSSARCGAPCARSSRADGDLLTACLGDRPADGDARSLPPAAPIRRPWSCRATA